jgi:curved DNA-binding protein
MSYYDVLGIPFNADEETIRGAFRMLARRYHPDAGETSSAEKFRQVVEAYGILRDPAQRRHYDRSVRPGHQRVSQVEPMVPASEPFIRSAQSRTRVFVHYAPRPDWEDLFDDIFRSMDALFGSRLVRW